MWYVYILKCLDDSYYTGITNDVSHRFKKHCDGKGAGYTNRNSPVKVVYEEEYESKSSAMRRENQLKRWSRAKKVALIQGDFNKLRQLSISHDA